MVGGEFIRLDPEKGWASCQGLGEGRDLNSLATLAQCLLGHLERQPAARGDCEGHWRSAGCLPWISARHGTISHEISVLEGHTPDSADQEMR